MKSFLRSLAIPMAWILCAANARAQSSYSSPETGHKALGMYFATDIDDVSLTNGNLHVHIPLFSLPGREIPASLAVDYDSQFYEAREYSNNGQNYQDYEFMGWRKSSGIGGKLTGTATRQYNYYMDEASQWNNHIYSQTLHWDLAFTWLSPSGTRYAFTQNDVAQTCYEVYQGTCNSPSPDDAHLYDNLTMDAPGSEFIQLKTGEYFSGSTSVPAWMTFKDGTRINVSTPAVVTLNGNQVQGNTSSGTLTNMNSVLSDFVPSTDTLGRTIGYSVSGNGTQVSGTGVQLSAEAFGFMSKTAFLAGVADTIEDGVWLHYVSQVIAECDK